MYASWSPTRYVALYVLECPDVRFDDVVIGAPWYGNDNGGSALVYHGQQP